jgi:hypothetical protein
MIQFPPKTNACRQPSPTGSLATLTSAPPTPYTPEKRAVKLWTLTL